MVDGRDMWAVTDSRPRSSAIIQISRCHVGPIRSLIKLGTIYLKKYQSEKLQSMGDKNNYDLVNSDYL